MSNYFTQYLPNINLLNNGHNETQSVTESTNSEQVSISPVAIKYLTIFNPSLVSPKEDSNEELYKQILTFLQRKDDEEISKLDQLKLVGLMRGV